MAKDSRTRDSLFAMYDALDRALPGALMGGGAAMAASQSGWLEQTPGRMVGIALAGGAITTATSQLKDSPAVRRTTTVITLIVTLCFLWLAQNTKEIDSVPDALVSTTAEEQSQDENAAAAEALACPQILIPNQPPIPGAPTNGARGSRQQPIQAKAVAGAIYNIAIEADEAYDFVLVSASATELPFFARDVSFDDKSLRFNERRVEVEHLKVISAGWLSGLRLRIGDDGLTSPDEDMPRPFEDLTVPFGVIEVSGGFRRTEAASAPTFCPFRFYVRLIAQASGTPPGVAGITALAAGAALTSPHSRDWLRRLLKALRKFVEDYQDNSMSPEKSRAKREAALANETVDDRRLGVDALLEGKKLLNALVAGDKPGDEPTTIVVSMGRKATAQLSAQQTANYEFNDLSELELLVSFVDTSPGIAPEDVITQTAEMVLSSDIEESAKVRFKVNPTGTEFKAMINIFSPDNVLKQTAQMRAAVFPTRPEADASDPTIELDWIPVQSFAPGNVSTPAATVIHDDDVAIGTHPVSSDDDDTLSRIENDTAIEDDAEAADVAATKPLSVDVESTLGQIEEAALAIKTASALRLSSNSIEKIYPTLVGIARAGHEMYTAINLEQFEDEDRIQVVSVSAKSVLPLELAYQAHRAPRADAEICPTWEHTGRCLTCKDLEPIDQAKLVCPSLFWGVAKTVEHHTVTQAEQSNSFGLRILRHKDSRPVEIPALAIVGASDRVVDDLEDDDLDDATIDGPLPKSVIGEIDKVVNSKGVKNWEDWLAQVATLRPGMLIALAHQGMQKIGESSSAALEIGGVNESNIEQEHVLPPDGTRPIVLLIGCNTGVEKHVISSFAAKFRRFSPLVIATIGEIIAEEAPMIAATIINELRLQGASTEGTAGEAVRRARTTLLRDGRLAALQLVVHGDGTWPVGD